MNRTVLFAVFVAAFSTSSIASAQTAGPLYTCSKSVTLGGLSYRYEIASVRLLPGATWDVQAESMRFGGAYISVEIKRPFDTWERTAAGRALTRPDMISQPSLSIIRTYRKRNDLLNFFGVKIELDIPNYIWGDYRLSSRDQQRGRWLLRAGGASLMDFSETYGVIRRTPAYIESVASVGAGSSSSPPRTGFAGYQTTLDSLSAGPATLEIYDEGTLLGRGTIGALRPNFSTFDQIAARETAVYARPGTANPSAQGCVPYR